MVYGLYHVTKLIGGGVPTSVRDYYSLRLYHLLLFTYYPTSSASIFPYFTTTLGHPPTWASPISVPPSPSSARGHPPTWASPVSIQASPTPRSSAPAVFPWPQLCVPLAPSPPPSFLLNFLQFFYNMFILCLLVPPCVPPAPSLLISRLSCAHLENWPQRYPMYHRPLSSSNVGHFRLGSRRFPYYFLP